jgi:surfactin synthase thioesterase subunit
VSEAHVRGWARFTRGAVRAERVAGNHLWPLDRAAKAEWLGRIAARLDGLLG